MMFLNFSDWTTNNEEVIEEKGEQKQEKAKQD